MNKPKNIRKRDLWIFKDGNIFVRKNRKNKLMRVWKSLYRKQELSTEEVDY